VRLYLWVFSLHDDTILTLSRHLLALNRRAVHPRQESFALVSYVNASFFLSLRSHTSLVIYMHSMGQYGRNKNKAREANPTPPREVATPSAVSKKQPSLNDAHRTPNGYHPMNDSAKKRTSESSLHSPNQQQSPKSPGPASSRASTDAITHVYSSQTRMNLPLIFFSQGRACTAVGRTGLG
jgi:hypothetical protein